MKNTTLFCALAVLVCGAAAFANPYVTATYAPLQTGGYKLDFVVYNYQEYGCDKWGITTVGLAGEITDLVAPVGWHALIWVRETEWKTDQLPSVYVVPPGGILRGCAAVFSILPAELDYYVMYGGYGGTLVPTPVPEPSSLVALSAGLAGLGALVRRRESHRLRVG